MQKIRILAPQVPVILMSGWGSIDLAVRGMRLGAFDFITKPWNNLLLLKRVATAIEIAPAHCGDDAVGSGGVEFGIIGNHRCWPMCWLRCAVWPLPTPRC